MYKTGCVTYFQTSNRTLVQNVSVTGRSPSQDYYMVSPQVHYHPQEFGHCVKNNIFINTAPLLCLSIYVHTFTSFSFSCPLIYIIPHFLWHLWYMYNFPQADHVFLFSLPFTTVLLIFFMLPPPYHHHNQPPPTYRTFHVVCILFNK